MRWSSSEYGGASSDAALQMTSCNMGGENVRECVVINNLDRGIRVANNATFAIEYSDIYGNGYGLENLHATATVQYPGNSFWGSPSGPSHTSNPAGTGKRGEQQG